jgi:hypothetical protein
MRSLHLRSIKKVGYGADPGIRGSYGGTRLMILCIHGNPGYRDTWHDLTYR